MVIFWIRLIAKVRRAAQSASWSTSDQGVFSVREVVGLHPARLCWCALRFQGGERDLPGFPHRMADPLKNSQVGFARAERMEGYTGEIARREKPHGVPQPGGKFVEGVREVVVERRSR